MPHEGSNQSVPILGIRPPQPFSVGGNAAENRKMFKQRWSSYTILSGFENLERKVQVALILNLLADDALKAYNGFQFDTPDEERTVKEIMEKMEKFCVGEVNQTYERFIFNSRKQSEGEPMDAFISDLRDLVKTYGFCNDCLPSMIMDRIVLGVSDSKVQTELLKRRDLTLEQCIDICKASESALAQNSAMRPNEQVHRVATNDKKEGDKPKKRQMRQNSELRSCKFCGESHKMKKELCPAYGKTCSKCGLKNHFAVKCFTEEKRRVHQMQDSEPEWVYVMKGGKLDKKKDVKCLLMVDGEEVHFQIDTGSSVNLLPKKYATVIQPTSKILRTWDQGDFKPEGVCRRVVENPRNGRKYSVEFLVYEGNLTPLLGLQASQQMNFINVQTDNFVPVNNVRVEEDYGDVMRGDLGKLEGEHHLKVRPDVQPVVMPTRRVPISVRPKLEEELNRLEGQGVLEKVEQPTPWVSQMAITEKKDGSLRVCIDPQELNKALQREHTTLPVLEDTLHDLGQSRVFSKVDLKSGYWHVSLDKESSMLTTFQTCFGRYRWFRLPFGLSVSAEIFQKRLQRALEGLEGVVCVADDVIIHGKKEEEHERNLKNFLERCREKGIKLNKEKTKLREKSLVFMGHLISEDGLQSDPEKVRAIVGLQAPENLHELRRFLGMVNYLSRYLPHVTTVLQPLQNLLRKEVAWTWSNHHEEAFQETKKMIETNVKLAYYDPNKELVLENDASEYGLGTVMMQEGKPVAFASRTLSPAERNYAQIEKEMLAVKYGLEKFHHYTYGRPVTVVTDHKPLVSIRKKPLAKAPKRLQNMLLNTEKYTYDLVFKPGAEIPAADAMSRAPLKEMGQESEPFHAVYAAPFKQERLNEIRGATEKDATLQQLRTIIMAGWPADKSALPETAKPYFNYRDELSVHDGIIVRGDRVVIPKTMRQDLLMKVHAGHSGINSCLRRARDLIFWPGMSNDIREYLTACDTCASSPPNQAPEPIYSHAVPDRPWEKVGTDLFHIEGRNYLVTVDYFSQFVEVDYLTETTSQMVVSKLKGQFARHGIPDVVVSDNGPQFASSHFAQFAKTWHFDHQPSSPGNSKGNGAAEAAVKVVKRMMKRCQAAREDPYLGLLNIRNTPQEGMDTSPAQRLMSRRTRTVVPTCSSRLQPKENLRQKEQLEAKKATTAEKLVGRRVLKPLQVGDSVRMQPIDGKANQSWKQAVVTSVVKPRSYEVESEGTVYRRNRQFLRASQQTEPPRSHAPAEAPPSPKEAPNAGPAQSIAPLVTRAAPTAKPVDTPLRTRSGRPTRPPVKLNL